RAGDDIAHDPDASTAQPVEIEELRVIAEHLGTIAEGGGVPRVRSLAGDDSKDDGCVGHRAAVRADNILVVRDGHNAGAAGQPQRRLDTHDAVVVRRANYGTVGFGPERAGGEVR